MGKSFAIALGLLFTCFSAKGQTLPAPYNLRTDLLLNTSSVSEGGLRSSLSLEKALSQRKGFQYPEIVSAKPALTWELDPGVAAISGYHVLVASSIDLLHVGKADFWESKKVKSEKNRTIYQGKSLIPGKVYYWKVQVWDKKGRKTGFSNVSSFVFNSKNKTEPFSHFPLVAEMEKAQFIHPQPEGSYFLDFGKDALAQLKLRLTSEGADTITIEVGELTDGKYAIHKNPGRNIRYLKLPLALKDGTHDYHLHWPGNLKRDSRNPILMPDYVGEVFPFRYVSIHGYKGILDQETVHRKMVYYPFDEQASDFFSSDTTLNQVWDLCKYSMKATSFTGYYVDGDRERIPYEADALINQLSHYAVDSEYSMARRTLDYLLYHPTWPTEWSLQNVIIAWNDYMYTGDNHLIKKYYSELQKKTLIALAGSNGLISTRIARQSDEFLASIHMNKNFDGRRGLHDNVDWPQTGSYVGDEKEYAGETDGFVYNGYNAVVNAYYYRSLVLMQKIASVSTLR